MGITFTLPNIGLKIKLLQVLEAMINYDVSMGLFTAPSSISDTTIKAELGEASFPGYGAQAINSGTVTGSLSDTIASLSSSPITFTCSGGGSPQTIEGVFCYANSYDGGNDLLALALLPNGPQVVSQLGDSIVAQLTLTDQRAPGQP